MVKGAILGALALLRKEMKIMITIKIEVDTGLKDDGLDRKSVV
jgi:hypothetical protein